MSNVKSVQLDPGLPYCHCSRLVHNHRLPPIPKNGAMVGWSRSTSRVRPYCIEYTDEAKQTNFSASAYTIGI